ncbi:MAG: TRAP transporter small permease [Defluviitaleaceae bacterium]|nr:TRAP transporter small permease [Defluviitaleaceae bacterium]
MENQTKGKDPLRILWKIDDYLEIAERHVATLLFIAMIFFMVYQVTARFILQIPAPWTEELSRYLWICMGFIGSAVAMKNHQHIEINIIASFFDNMQDEKKKAKMTKLLDLVRFAIIFGFCVYMAQMCFDFTIRVIATNQLTPALQIPKWWIDAVICFGWAAMAFHSAIIIAKTLSPKTGDES